jgi:Zn-dependent protease with chaperone function
VFYFIAIVECLTVNFLVLICASLICLPASRLIAQWTRHRHPGTQANFLFAVRVFPAGLAALLAFGFALPGFLLFEPRPSNDYIGPLQIALATAGGLFSISIVTRITRAMWANFQVTKYWKSRSTRVQISGIDAPTYAVNGIPSLFVVVGLLRPCVFVGKEIIQQFSAEEMAAAAAHEMAHIRSRDNLKQLLMEVSRPPSWLQRFGMPDDTWVDASELAADHSTLSLGNKPLQLASALLKVGKLRNSFAAHFAVGAHLVPAHCSPRLENRVTHLIALADVGFTPGLQQLSRRMVYTLAITSTVLFILCYAATAPELLHAAEEALDILF